VRVQGTVIAVEASRTVYVADGDASIAIYSEGGCRAVPGNLLDSAGFPAVINERPGWPMQSAVMREPEFVSLPKE